MTTVDLSSLQSGSHRRGLGVDGQKAASPVALRRMVGRTLTAAGIGRVPSAIRPRPGYEILGSGGDGAAVYAILGHSTGDDAMVRLYGRVLRAHNFAVTYFQYDGCPLLRVDADAW